MSYNRAGGDVASEAPSLGSRELDFDHVWPNPWRSSESAGPVVSGFVMQHIVLLVHVLYEIRQTRWSFQTG
jgi:hypothetical protein